MHKVASRTLVSATVVALAVVLTAVPATANGPGRGLTAQFEIDFMKMTIDHHFSALRMTELAAGTDLLRNAQVSGEEGTAPTPGFAPTQAKATLPDLKSMARRNDRMQREEILTLQMFLRDWYGIVHQPAIPASAQPMIAILEQARPGHAFNHAFFETFSRHHFMLMQPVNGCMTGTELRHFDLRRLCSNMWHSQTADIDEMRHELERHYGIYDYQPFNDEQPLAPQPGSPRGQHSGNDAATTP